jgi:hypothetical protein
VVWLAGNAAAVGEEKPGVPPVGQAGAKPAGQKGAQRGNKAEPAIVAPLDAAGPHDAPVHKDWMAELTEGWKGFASLAVVDVLIALLLATILSSFVAYHPRSYGKAATLEEAEQPKVFLVYSVIGGLIGQIFLFDPRTAFVIFGLGGLFRFRTEVGPAKDTGRAILATCIGLCCGVKIYVPAVLGTAFAWVLIYVLEGRVAHRVVVKGIEPSLLGQAAEAYEEVLRENGLTVLSEKKNFLKGQVAFVFRAPGQLNREQLESLFKDIPPKLQGSPDWESS